MFTLRLQIGWKWRVVSVCKCLCLKQGSQTRSQCRACLKFGDSGRRSFHVTSSYWSILSDPENKGHQQRGVNFDTLGSWNNRLTLPILVEQSIKKGKLIPKIPLEEVGTASLIGRRRMNEDRMVVKELTEQLIYIGIFDGHCTSFAADYVLEYLEHHINYWLSRTDKLETVLHKSFVEVNNVLARHLAFYFMSKY